MRLLSYFLSIGMLTLVFPLSAQVVINEIYAQVALGTAGDANGDRRRDAADDEFVELYNLSNQSISLAGYEIWVGSNVKHRFPDSSSLSPRQLAVVFGGGKPNGPFGESWVQTASTGAFNMPNTGDTVQLVGPTGDVLQQVIYDSEASGASWNRRPEGTGDFQLHASFPEAYGFPYSPGTLASTFPFNSGETTLVHFATPRAEAVEIDGSVSLFLNLFNPFPEAVRATVELVGGSGTAADLDGEDTWSVNFPVNSNSQRRLDISITDDDLPEGTETFIFEITALQQGEVEISVNHQLQLTVFDDNAVFPLQLIEFLPDPPLSETDGDANGDGLREADADEFVEFKNHSDTVLDISGLEIHDMADLRHLIPDSTQLNPGQTLLVFGGGNPTGDFGTAVVQSASENRLSLANSGDRILLRQPDGTILFFHQYDATTGGANQSSVFCADSDSTGTFRLHGEVTDNIPFSPGRPTDCGSRTVSVPTTYSQDLAIEIYPNPAHASVRLKLPTGIQLFDAELTAITGQSFPVTLQGNRLSWTAVPTGLYFIRWFTDVGVASSKLYISNK